MDFEKRIKDNMNLLVTYGSKQDLDERLDSFKFLGAAYDIEGREIHVFQKFDISLENKLDKINELSRNEK